VSFDSSSKINVTTITSIASSKNGEEKSFLERKITLASEGFTTKFCESILRDRNRLSKENALVVAEYAIAIKREVNPRPSYLKYTIQYLSELSRRVGLEKRFKDDMTREDILYYLDSNRKTENEDPLHKWIGSYNLKCLTIIRFFKWLYYPDIGNPKRRNELFKSQRKPECIIDIPRLKRKEISCYKPSDLWTQEDDLFFLKWVTNKRDRCYHTMARDLSARPHEILNLKIKDIRFKTVDKYQYAEVLVNGKTGSRCIPLIQSIPYIKDWLSNHPSRNNPNSPLFIGLGRRSMGKQLTISGVYQVYKYYKEVFFPKLLADPTVVNEDKEKLKNLLIKPFNPYIRRHSALTEKSIKLKTNTLNQHAGWSTNSNMTQKYIHYFGNESSESLLEAYGIVIKDNIPINTLNPKICPNCNEGNTQDAKFCSKCKMIMSFEGYQEALDSQKEGENEMKAVREQLNSMQTQMQALVMVLATTKDQNKINELSGTLFGSGIIKKA
jgi:integrase/recombinase XerD